QKAFQASLMVLATFTTACNAQCYAIALDNNQGNVHTQCKDINGVIHPLNSKWRNSYCEECYCGEREISCCNLILEPAGFDATCEKIFHESNCSYTVVEKNNPGKPCSVGTWVV
uniref:Beta-microseminoprotein n=1 Tax=Urocitellus parryii TaxID=9999 RepID=A0A8D2GXZ0_UROPR